MKHKSKIFFSLLLSALISTETHALSVQNFHPVIGQRNHGITLFGSSGLSRRQIESGIFVNYDVNPLEFSLPPDDRVNGIVNRFLTVDALMSFGITDWLTFHFDFPFNPYSNVEPIATYQATNDASVGDPRFSATLNLYKIYDDQKPEVERGGIALIPFVTVPMDNNDDFFGDRSWTGGGLFAMDRHLGKRHYFGLNIGAKFRKKREQILDLNVNHEALASLSYVYRLSCKARLDIVFEGNGSTAFREFLTEEISSPVEAIFGIRKESQSKHWQWTIGAGRGVNNGYGAPDYRVFGGISYLFFNHNKPQAHCCDAVQAKPVEVVEQTKPQVNQLGSMNIEIVDSNDKPIVLPIQIYKNDQLILENTSNRIRTPIEAGKYQIRIQSHQINELTEVTSSQETYKKIIIPVEPVKVETVVKYIEPIYFDSAKDTIKSESYAALDQVYSIIQTYPAINSIQIEAHTDSQGKDAYNLDLSKRRAQSDKNYLVQKGVDESKIKTTGFGEVRPIDTNETSAGRAKNRRVEFLIKSPSQNIQIIQKK